MASAPGGPAQNRASQQPTSKNSSQQSSPFSDPFFAGTTSNNAPAARAAAPSYHSADRDPFSGLSGQQPSSRASGPAPTQQAASADDDDFLGTFSSTPKPPEAGKASTLGGNQPMQSTAAKSNEPSRLGPAANATVLDADSDFMSGWSTMPSTNLQQHKQAQSTTSGSGGDPFDLFGDAGGVAAMPTPAPPAKPAPPAHHLLAAHQPCSQQDCITHSAGCPQCCEGAHFPT